MKIKKINPFKNSKMVKAIALVYQQSFSGGPWNEGYLCPICKKGFAKKIKSKVCPYCIKEPLHRKILLVEYWPTDKVISDFYHEMIKPGAICVTAESKQKIIGFAWGYKVSVDINLDTHLDAPGIHNLLDGDFFYLDECAVLPILQGIGVGKSIVNYIFHNQPSKKIILRTMDDSRMCNIIKSMGGEVIQKITKNRVIMRLIIT